MNERLVMINIVNQTYHLPPNIPIMNADTAIAPKQDILYMCIRYPVALERYTSSFFKSQGQYMPKTRHIKENIPKDTSITFNLNLFCNSGKSFRTSVNHRHIIAMSIKAKMAVCIICINLSLISFLIIMSVN